MNELTSNKSGSCCIKECEMLPALIDSENGEAVCGPEAIVTYITCVASKNCEMVRGSACETEIQMCEVRSMLVEFCYTLMHSSPTSKDSMTPII